MFYYLNKYLNLFLFKQGELVTIVKAMQTIYPESVRNRYSVVLPNKYNFGFDYFYFLVVVVLAYACKLDLLNIFK